MIHTLKQTQIILPLTDSRNTDKSNKEYGRIRKRVQNRQVNSEHEKSSSMEVMQSVHTKR